MLCLQEGSQEQSNSASNERETRNSQEIMMDVR